MDIFEKVKSEFLEFVIPSRKSGQIVLKFENGFGASFISDIGSYGNEIAVIYFKDGEDWRLCYSTDITDDVLAHLTEEEVVESLYKIKSLDERGRLGV